VPKQFFFENVDAEVESAVRSALSLLEAMGAVIIEVDAPLISEIPGGVTAIMLPEALAYHQKWMTERPDDYGDDVRYRLELGATFLAVHYVQAQRRREMAVAAWRAEVFSKVEIIATPTTPITARLIEEGDLQVTFNLIRFTNPLNFLGVRIGRRRFSASLFLSLAAAGIVFALTDEFWVLVPVALLGALSTDVVESGPFTSLEQAMLAGGVDNRSRPRVFGNYNAIATLAGSVGALMAGGPALLREAIGGFPSDQRFFLVFVPAGVMGAVVAARLSRQVELEKRPGLGLPRHRSRANVFRLAGLFAIDAFAGVFVVQGFIA